MNPILDDFYVNMKVDDFEKGRSINFANPDCWPEFEAELKVRGLEYVVAKGLNNHGLYWNVIRPEEIARYRNILLRQIQDTEEVLKLRKIGLWELEAEMKRQDKTLSRTLRIFPKHARDHSEVQNE